MKDFLAKLRPENKINVGISVSPTVGLEMMVVDAAQNKVVKYAHRPLVYNFSSREVEDYAVFKTLTVELFNELGIEPKNSNVVLNLPSVAFGHCYLPTVLDDESVTGALVSKAEESYLFKKNVPVVSWQEVKCNNSSDRRYILHSAIQEGVVDVIKQIFTDLGSTLIAIENSYSSLIKTLEYTGLVDNFAKTQGSWNILLVSQNSYAVFSLLDYNVIEYYEDPLAIKSFNGDEVYVAIAQAASGILDKFPSDKLLVISESNDVSAEILAMQIKHMGDVVFLDCNQYAKASIIDIDFNVLPNYVKAITPEIIGASVYRFKDFSLKLNFIENETLKQQPLINILGVELSQEQLYLYCIILGLFILVTCFIFTFALNVYNASLEEKRGVLEQEIVTLQTELSSLQKASNKIDIYSIAKTIDSSMSSKILYYNAIGSDIPRHVWLTDFYVDTQGACGIEGETTSVDEIYLFFRNIKAQVPNSNLILSKLSVDDQNGAIDIVKTKEANYSFALTNYKYANVKKKMQASAVVADGLSKTLSSPSSNANVPVLPPELP